MKVNELKKIIQEAVRTEVRKVLREELKSLSLTENIKEEILKPKVQEFKEHKLTRSPQKPLVNFGVKNSTLNDILAETAATGDFSSMGGGDNYRAQNFNPSINEGVQTDFNNNPVEVSNELNSVFTRDYSALMNAMDK
jgi:hypothetical protein